MVGEGPGLVASPGLKRGDELCLIDQPDLERDQPEQEVAVTSVCGHCETPGLGVVQSAVSHGTSPRTGRREAPHRGLFSQKHDGRANRSVRTGVGGGTNSSKLIHNPVHDARGIGFPKKECEEPEKKAANMANSSRLAQVANRMVVFRRVRDELHHEPLAQFGRLY